MAATATIGRIAVSFTANTASFLMQVKNAEKKVATSSKKMGDSTKKLSVKGVAGFAALGVALAKVAQFSANAAFQFSETNKQLRQLGDTAGMTAEEMRRQAFIFRETGLGAEQMAEIFKDVKDKVGEYAALGTGVFEDFHNTLGQTRSEGMKVARQLQYMSGPQVLGYMTEEMEKANVSGAQMTFVLESIANNSSRMRTALSGQSKAVKKLAEEYDNLAQSASKESHRQLEDTMGSWQLFVDSLGAVTLEAMEPTFSLLEETFKVLTDMLPDTDQTKVTRFSGSKERELQEQNSHIVDPLENAKAMQRGLMDVYADVEAEYNRISKRMKDNPLIFLVENGEEQLELTAKHLQSIVNLQSKYSEMSHKINADRERDAKKDSKEISKLVKDTGVDVSLSLAEQYKQRKNNMRKAYADEVKAFEDKYKHIMFGTDEYESALNRMYTKHRNKAIAAQKSYNDAVIAEEERKKNELTKKENELRERQKATYDLLSFVSPEDSAARLENEKRLELMALEDKYAKFEELHEIHKQAIDVINAKYAEKEKQRVKDLERQQIEKSAASATAVTGAFGAMGDAAAAFSDKSSTLAKAAFGLQKGAALSQALINAHLSVTEAWADSSMPWYAKAAAAVTAFANVTAAIGAMRSVNFNAQAHGGMDEVPSHLNNSSFILKAGERVIQPEANKDLTKFLSGDSGQGQGQTMIDASIHVSGNVTDQAWFKQELVKQREVIAASVRKVEKERPLSQRRK